MLLIHAIKRHTGVDARPHAGVKSWRSRRLSDGGRFRGGILIQCGPALTEEAI
jgi:hypothetical protein